MDNINYTPLIIPTYGKNRREQLTLEGFFEQGYYPKTMSYEDYDRSFKEWVDKELEISYNGQMLTTHLLLSIQRFSEYGKLWKLTNTEGSLLLNFKTIHRELNVQGGSIMGNGMRNIPGERYFTMGFIPIIENGIESYDTVEMKQPIAVDFKYTITIFCSKLEIVNNFNRKIVDKFKALEAYLHVNSTYWVSMELVQISDETKYEIEERRFYSQSFQVLVKGYLLQEEDFRRRRMQTRQFVAIDTDRKNNACVTIEEDNKCCNSVNICVDFPPKAKPYVKFRNDETIFVKSVSLENIKSFEMRRDSEDEWLKFDVRGCYKQPEYFCLINYERIEIRKVIKEDELLPSKIFFHGITCQCTNPPYNTEIDQEWLNYQIGNIILSSCVFPKQVVP